VRSEWFADNANSVQGRSMVGYIQHIPQQSLGEDISLLLSSFVAEALKIRCGIPPSRYLLMGIEFGSEFGRHTLGVSAI
jgi:hypothetical protein